MSLIKWFLKSWWSVHLALMLAFSLTLYPSAVLATEVQFNPAVSDVVKTFSTNYCKEISKGAEFEKAAEVASRQMISSLIFSGVFKEVKAAPKEDLAAFVSTVIVETCEQDLPVSQKELNDYLLDLAINGEMQQNSSPQPFRPFGMG